MGNLARRVPRPGTPESGKSFEHFVLIVLGLFCAAASGQAGWAQAASPQNQGVTLFVAPIGRDTWSGKLAEPNAERSDGPLATVGRARDRLRQLKPLGAARVLLRGGIYHLEGPLVFTSEDSGTEEAPRAYESFPGETAILAGTRVVVVPWREEGRNVYATEMDRASSGSFRTVFVDGKRATWARFPNQGFLQATGGKGKTVIEVAPGIAKPSWARDPEATVNIIAERGWYNQLVRVAGVGPAGEWIELAGRETQGNILAGNRFFVEGVREELDQEGEWYLDRKAARLYYYSSSPLAGRRVEIATVDRLIEVRGKLGQPVRYLAFRGLGFFGSDYTVDHIAVRTNQDAAIHLVNAHNVEISGCRFDSVGGYAVWLHLDSRGNVIRQNEIVESGAGGVLLTAARFSYASDNDIFDPAPEAQQVAPVGNVILGNHIHRGGVIRAYCSGVHLDSRPLALSQVQGNYVGFNHIHDMPRNGIFAFRNQGGNIFEANHIHDVLQRTNDGGAIHLASMNPLCAPTHIIDNRIYRVGYQGGGTNVNLSFGIYPDWFTSRMVIRGNIVTDTRDGGIRLLGGDDARMEDNLVGDDPTASIVFGHWNTKSVRGITLKGNTVINGKGHWIRFYVERSGLNIDSVVARPAEQFRSEDNTFWGRGSGGGLAVAAGASGPLKSSDRAPALDAWQAAGGEARSVVRDPGADGAIDTSTNPDTFGQGTQTMRRMAVPRSPEEAKTWLRKLEGTAAFATFYDSDRVSGSPDWKPTLARISDNMAFADQQQAESRETGGAISFTAILEPGASYEVFVKWYGPPAERAPEVDVELTAPGAKPQTIRLNHRQEAHKWLRVGVVEPRSAGQGAVTIRNFGGGMTAINSVAWLKLPAQ